MIVEVIQGDLIAAFVTGKINNIAHQANCMNIFGAGIAVHLEKYFLVSKALMNEKPIKHIDSGKQMANISTRTSDYGLIINMHAQLVPGPPSLSYDTFAIRIEALKSCVAQIDKLELANVGIPLVASGLAADRTKKNSSDALSYFNTYIAPIFDAAKTAYTVYYL